jgi:hypothetical protein
MKLRLTPLNIVIAVLLFSAAFQILKADNVNLRQSIFFILMVLTCFITDLLFRRFLTDLKRIWIIELLFIIFAAVIFALIALK